MKIALFSSRYYPHRGGVENVMNTLKTNISNTYVITSLEQVYKSFKDFFATYKQEQDNVIRFFMSTPRSILGFVQFPYKALVSLYHLNQFMIREKFDLVNYHFPDDTLFYFAYIHKLRQFKYVLNIHGNDLHVYSKKCPHKYVFPYIIKHASRIVVNSEYMRGQLIDKFITAKNKIVVIPNSIDVEAIMNAPVEKYFDHDYIIFIGRLVHKKGVDVLLRAFSQADVDGLKLVIEGMGEELHKLENLVKQLNLEDRVVFTKGKMSVEDKNRYMKGALFGVIPSRIEPFGIVALEFFAGKTPVICSHTGGLESLGAGGNALFFENENVNDLSEKIKMLYDEPNIRESLVKTAFDSVQHYDEDHVIEEYKKLFEHVSHE